MQVAQAWLSGKTALVLFNLQTEDPLPLDETRLFKPVQIALLTVSDTRSVAEDTSGDILAARISVAGHVLGDRVLLRDDVSIIIAQLHAWIEDEAIDCVLITGGTGLTGRDVTPEALEKVKTKDIPGFGELFRWLSFASIGTSTIQSRACAVLARGTYIFALPGSNGAVKDGWDQILVHQLDSRHRPCNFVELMPRLREV
jgi:molybdopterin adenylyltransferase